jgi:hypothetical protein
MFNIILVNDKNFNCLLRKLQPQYDDRKRASAVLELMLQRKCFERRD